MVLAVTLAASLSPQVRFSADAPGPIVNAVTAGLKPDPRIAAYVEVSTPKPADSNRYTAPFFYRGDPQLPFFPSKKAGHLLIAIPYRLPGTPSRLSLRFDGKDYPIEIPESTGFGKASMPNVIQTEHGVRLDFKIEPRSTSLAGYAARCAVTTPKGAPCLIAFRSSRREKRPEDHYFLASSPNRRTPVAGGEGEIMMLKPVPLKLRISKSEKPTEYFMQDGTKLYSSNGRLNEDLGFVAVVFRNCVLANFRVVPLEVTSSKSYAAVQDGEIVDAIGYRRISTKPISFKCKLPTSGGLMLPYVRYFGPLPSLVKAGS